MYNINIASYVKTKICNATLQFNFDTRIIFASIEPTKASKFLPVCNSLFLFEYITIYKPCLFMSFSISDAPKILAHHWSFVVCHLSVIGHSVKMTQ